MQRPRVCPSTMSSSTEIEIKLEIPPEALAAVRRAVCTARVQRTALQALYFDALDRRLSKDRMALRLRKEGTQWVQTLKAAGSHGMLRLEHNVLVTGEGPDAPEVDPQRHAGTAVGERLLALLQGAALQVQYRTEVLRSHRVVKRAGVAIELALDQGFIEAGSQRWPVCELELELLQGQPEALVEEARRWVTRHGLWLDVRSKAERGERLARGRLQAPATKARALALSPEASAPAALRAVIANTLQQILPNASEIAAGTYRDEQVHQLRVGLRRLRTALRFFEGWCDEVDPAWAPALAEVFGQLGGVRDRAALTQALAPGLQAAGAPLVALPASVDPLDPVSLLRAPGFSMLCLALQAHAMSPVRVAEGAAPLPLRRLCRQRLRRWYQQVLRDVPAYATLDEPSQHRLRKRLKRLRYATEFCAALFPAQQVKRFLAAVAPVQETLGHFNDLCVAIPLYRQAAAQSPEAWFAVGWLSAQREQALAACVSALQPLASVRPAWAKR
jgi:triphosphatase